MKPPKTDAEWDAFLDADERELATARNEAEYEAILSRQLDRNRGMDLGPAVPIREALAELDEWIARLPSGRDVANGGAESTPPHGNTSHDERPGSGGNSTPTT
jgi:hypothetical protein